MSKAIALSFFRCRGFLARPFNCFKTVAAAVAAMFCLTGPAQAQTSGPHANEEGLPPKIEHAEPLFVDLIRDLGARKGESEWNVGMGMTDRLSYDRYGMLVEYEWAVRDRLGLEVELPFEFYSLRDTNANAVRRPARLESLKAAMQWTFMVKPEWGVSAALGYLNEVELAPLRELGRPGTIEGNLFNPFLVVARNWGNNWHTLVYTGPRITWHFGDNHWTHGYEFHTNIHYMLASRNFIGVEINKYFGQTYEILESGVTVRPQIRVSLDDNLLIGLVAGIPIDKDKERLSTFVRLIWEPGHKHRLAKNGRFGVRG